MRRGFLRWCYQGGSSLRVGQASDRSGDLGAGDTDPTVVLLTEPRLPRPRRRPGSSLRALRRAFRGARRRYTVNGKVGGRTSPPAAAGWRSSARGRVVYLAAWDRGRVRCLSALRALLKGARG